MLEMLYGMKNILFPARLHACTREDRSVLAPGGPAVWRDQPVRALSDQLAMILIELRASEDLEGGYANVQMTPEGTKMTNVAPANSLLHRLQHRFNLSPTQHETH
jgi:hypothetical protein